MKPSEIIKERQSADKARVAYVGDQLSQMASKLTGENIVFSLTGEHYTADWGEGYGFERTDNGLYLYIVIDDKRWYSAMNFVFVGRTGKKVLADSACLLNSFKEANAAARENRGKYQEFHRISTSIG